MVCIIDDREDVWSHATNLIHVKPYHFFQHTGDINAPPGLDKHEDDNKSCIDLTKAFTKSYNIEKMNSEPPRFKDNGGSEDDEKEKQINDENGKIIEDKKEKEIEEDKKNAIETKEEKESKDEKEEEVKNEKEKEVKVEREKEIKDGEEKENKQENEEEIKNGEEKEVKDEKENEMKHKKESAVQDSSLKDSHQELQSVNSSSNEQIDGNTILEDNAVIPENKQIETEVNSNKFNGNVESQEKSISQNSVNSKLVEYVIQQKPPQIQQTKELTDNKDNIQNLSDNLNKENKIIEVENKQKHLDNSNNADNLIEVEDPDDYLIYLEDILKRIHKEFYDEYDQMERGEVPDLKQVIPKVRNNVLKGCNLVFSGLVPTHIKLKQSKAYQVARSLGATVTQDLEDDTTHLVAVRPGTAKVNAGRRKRNLKIVTPDWLWCCAER